MFSERLDGITRRLVSPLSIALLARLVGETPANECKTSTKRMTKVAAATSVAAILPQLD